MNPLELFTLAGIVTGLIALTVGIGKQGVESFKQQHYCLAVVCIVHASFYALCVVTITLLLIKGEFTL